MNKGWVILIGAFLALFLGACGGDDDDTPGTDGDTKTANEGSTAVDFDKCIESLTDCNFDTMGTACSSMKTLAIPLTDGTTYGPMTVEAGPYGTYVEWNVGQDTEFVNVQNPLEPVCIPTGIETFAEPAAVNAEIEDLRGMDWTLYTIFRPACFKKGEKYPVITWANGTCGETGGYAGLLAGVASYGFVIIASNSTWTGTPPTNDVQLRALDYAKALNEDPGSIYYKKLDMDNIGAMGHSQGSSATRSAATDPRIKAVILWNGGTSNDKPFLYVSGERDIGNSTTPESLASATDSATQPGAWVYYHKVLVTGGNSTGHLTLMEQPNRVVDLAVAWWKWMLNDDAEAKKMFIGNDCGFCKTPDEYDYGHNSLLQ